jgi:hypothetical protein
MLMLACASLERVGVVPAVHRLRRGARVGVPLPAVRPRLGREVRVHVDIGELPDRNLAHRLLGVVTSEERHPIRRGSVFQPVIGGCREQVLHIHRVGDELVDLGRAALSGGLLRTGNHHALRPDIVGPEVRRVLDQRHTHHERADFLGELLQVGKVEAGQVVGEALPAEQALPALILECQRDANLL